MTSNYYEEFTPPQSNQAHLSRDSKVTISLSREPNNQRKNQRESEPSGRKRVLSVYNIFYKEMRKIILTERGYIESDATACNDSPPQKRGRPRGPNYNKKKTPHRVIGFVDLTKEIAARWKTHKEEYYKKYGAIVESNKARNKESSAKAKGRKKSNAKHPTPKDRFHQKKSIGSNELQNISDPVNFIYKQNSINMRDEMSRTSYLPSSTDVHKANGIKSISKVETNRMTLANQLSSNRNTNNYKNEFNPLCYPVNRTNCNRSMRETLTSTDMLQEKNFFERYSLPLGYKRYEIDLID